MYHRTDWGCSKEFFNGTNARSYFESFRVKMKAEVDRMSDAEIASCDFAEWAR